MRAYQWHMLLAVVTVFFSIVRVDAQSDSRTVSTNLVSTIELANYSYALRSDPEYRNGEVANAGVLFSSSEVICYFVVRTAPQNVKRSRAPKTSESLQLKVVRLGADTSKTDLAVLPASSGLTSVMNTHDGSFIVRTGDSLRLYDRDFKLLRERTLYKTGKYDDWNIRISASGRTVLLDHYDPSGSSQEILDSTLQTLKVVRLGRLTPSFAISDSRVVAPDSGEHTIFVREFGGPWYSVKRRDAGRCVGDPVLLTDSTILVSCGRDTVVLSLAGEVLMKEMPPNKQHFEAMVSVTPNGKFFAASAMRTRGGFMDYTAVKRSDTTVLVYNRELRKEIARVALEQVPQHDYDFALSPDGDRLAIMTDHLLRVYELPK